MNQLKAFGIVAALLLALALCGMVSEGGGILRVLGL